MSWALLVQPAFSTAMSAGEIRTCIRDHSSILFLMKFVVNMAPAECARACRKSDPKRTVNRKGNRGTWRYVVSQADCVTMTERFVMSATSQIKKLSRGSRAVVVMCMQQAWVVEAIGAG